MTLFPDSGLSKQLYVGYHTGKRLQFRQLAGIAERKARERLLPRVPVDFDAWYERRVPENPAADVSLIRENGRLLRRCLSEETREQYRRRTRESARGTPTFMGTTLQIAEGTEVSWHDDRFEELPLLWALKLYSFQPLGWLCSGIEPGDATTLRETFDGWIEDWIESTAIGSKQYLRRTWTPWAVSLRILRWCRYLAWRRAAESSNDPFDRTLRQEIYKNTLFLENHIEWDVGGNHLIENGTALVVAGLLFQKGSWIEKGKKVLRLAGSTQFLDDGAHFERSPMYHIVTLTRYLTVSALLDNSSRTLPERVEAVARDGTAFLQYLRPPNGRMPLLNDAVYGQSLPINDCLAYADQLGFDPEQSVLERRQEYESEESQTSGYEWLRTNAGALLIDCGEVGPAHLPGHSHSDTLSILLWLDEQPIVTDTGTAGYVTDVSREYARGVKGHNTVQVGESEPIAIGGKYLMGPRPTPRTRVQKGTVSLIEGVYDTTPYQAPDYSHHRVVFSNDHWWAVRDTVRCEENTPSRSRLHLHPAVSASMDESGRVRLTTGQTTASVVPLESARISIGSGSYFPRFGERTNRPVLTVHAQPDGETRTTFGYVITTDPREEAEISENSSGTGCSRLLVGEENYSLPDLKLQP